MQMKDGVLRITMQTEDVRNHQKVCVCVCVCYISLKCLVLDYK